MEWYQQEGGSSRHFPAHRASNHASRLYTILMQLTPLRVRRKRGAPTTNTPVALQSREKKMRKSIAAARASRSLRQRPVLASLPAEILESILLHSMSTALPHASPLIGAKLSSRATLLRFFIWAFHDTWEQSFGVAMSWQQSEDAAADARGSPSIQTKVLALPWVTIDFILQAQQSWADRYGRGRSYQHHPVESGDIIATSESHLELHGHGNICHPFDARACFEADYQRAVALYLTRDRTWHQDVHPRAHIPQSLLTGPWDEEQLRRLFWLVRSGPLRGEETLEGVSWETKMLCLRNAVLDVSEPQPLVFNYVVRRILPSGEYPPRDILRKELTNVQTRLKWGDDSPEGKQIVEGTRELLQLMLDS
ncbi:hypothetical protein HJFPF1_04988 [Paramyrothecium foliicola]|nr:hypothetical protein HJFPF1_04988 [Paramyrothecium foliicola]